MICGNNWEAGGQIMKLSPKSKWEWFRFSALLLMGILLLIRMPLMFNIQYMFLYYPSPSAPPEELLRASNMKLWRASGTDYRGFVASHQPIPGKGTVIVFHGNAGSAADRAYYLGALGALGYRVVLAEYPAYGGRKGELGENSFVRDAKESIRLASEDFGGPLFLLGESLGCGVAAAATRETSVQIDGVILITPWDSLASVAQEKFPFFPIRLFLKDQYDSIGNLGSFKGRIAVAGAERDEIVPVAHARKLYASLPGENKRMWTFRGAGHNDWYLYADEAWWKEVMDFVSD